MSNEDNHHGRMREIISEVNEFIAARDFDGLDELVASHDVAESNHYELLAMARSTYPVHIKLPSWREFVERAREQLDMRGLNANLLLKGLI